jgi:hypothetical protein
MAVVAAYLTATPGTFGVIVRRGEVAIEFDEPPWNRSSIGRSPALCSRDVANRIQAPLFILALAAFSVR